MKGEHVGVVPLYPTDPNVCSQRRFLFHDQLALHVALGSDLRLTGQLPYLPALPTDNLWFLDRWLATLPPYLPCFLSSPRARVPLLAQNMQMTLIFLYLKCSMSCADPVKQTFPLFSLQARLRDCKVFGPINQPVEPTFEIQAAKSLCCPSKYYAQCEIG